MIDWKKVVIKPDSSLKRAIEVLQEGTYKIVLVANEDNRLLGTVTDGDIRRALIKKLPMNFEISSIMNRQPITVEKSAALRELLSLMSGKGLMHIPIVDQNGILCGLETLHHLIEKPLYDNPVFLMAGGFGTRLHPLTESTPKPLLRVGDKPILETIINQFIDQGFHNFYVSTHFESEQIRNYFKNGEQYGVSIQYIHENEPLGTAGSLGLLPSNTPNLPIIIMNGDILTRVNFRRLLDFHGNNNAGATMCVREYDFQVPYGVIDIDGLNIRKIREKPIQRFFVNAGIYVLDKNLVNTIDGKSYLNMTDFLKKELDYCGVSAFPIHEYWLDIGRMEEFEKANQDVITMFNE